MRWYYWVAKAVLEFFYSVFFRSYWAVHSRRNESRKVDSKLRVAYFYSTWKEKGGRKVAVKLLISNDAADKNIWLLRFIPEDTGEPLDLILTELVVQVWLK
jgi:hypothetical protein